MLSIASYYVFTYLFISVYTHECVCTHKHAWRSEGQSFKSCFSPTTTWVPGIELMSLGLGTSTFTCGAILPA